MKAQLIYDEPVNISPLVTRVLADNGSFMTGPGTNTYLIGHRDIAVIDPGPGSHYHLDAVLKAVQPGGVIKWILVTHNHPDHAPAATMLQKKTGAPICEFLPDGRFPAGYQSLKHNDLIETDEFCLQAIHTPGHASEHLCFLLQNENLLFSGDHIMQGSTVVIIPPSGHMSSYLTSLENLKKYPIDNIAPGHGHIIDDPFGEVDALIQHRLQRERKVLDALKQAGKAHVDQLVPTVYDDVPFFKHGIAAYSLEAHLIKLEEDSIVSRAHGVWYVN